MKELFSFFFFFFSSVCLNITSNVLHVSHVYKIRFFFFFFFSSGLYRSCASCRDWRWGGGWNVCLYSREVFIIRIFRLFTARQSYVCVCVCVCVSLCLCVHVNTCGTSSERAPSAIFGRFAAARKERRNRVSRGIYMSNGEIPRFTFVARSSVTHPR